MKYLAITQRIDTVSSYGERRDALDRQWYGFVEAAGFAPLVLPNDRKLAMELLERIPVAGALLTGGNDLQELGGDAPERDELERALIELAVAKRLPVLGICRGMQLIQHRFGAEFVEVEGHVTREQMVMMGDQKRTVNSFHSWGTRDDVAELETWARSEDGIVKAVRHKKHPIEAIMWHPERMAPLDDKDLEHFRRFFSDSQTQSAEIFPGTVYWVTGLSGAGKTTVGRLMAEKLRSQGRPVILIDGDEIREVLGNDLGHSSSDRKQSAMRNSRLCRMLSRQGVDVVCCTISMFHEVRKWNRRNIPHYREIYLEVPLDVLRARDPKGIYKRADRGELCDVYGIDLDWDEPDCPHVRLRNDGSLPPHIIAGQILSHLSKYGEVKL